MRRVAVRDERWPIAGGFTIARGTKTQAEVVVVEITEGEASGRGEAVPYARYGESLAGVRGQIEGLADRVVSGLSRTALQAALAPGAARNAIDCALWDLQAKRTGDRVWRLAGLDEPRAVETCFTISLAEPAAMAAAAAAAGDRPWLKLKIGGAHDLERIAAVRAAAPRPRLVVDANEALSFDELRRLAPDCARLGVVLIEQPLAAGADGELEGYDSPVMLCADESLHSRAELAACARRYGCVNVKLDKSGGLTEALALVAEARGLGLKVMIGCMVATSLAMAPAMLLAAGADVVDLDGPLLLAQDRAPGLVFAGSTVQPPTPALWG